MLHSLITKSVPGDLLGSVEAVVVEAMTRPRWSVTKVLHTIVTSDYIQNPKYSAQWLQPKQTQKRKTFC